MHKRIRMTGFLLPLWWTHEGSDASPSVLRAPNSVLHFSDSDMPVYFLWLICQVRSLFHGRDARIGRIMPQLHPDVISEGLLFPLHIVVAAVRTDTLYSASKPHQIFLAASAWTEASPSRSKPTELLQSPCWKFTSQTVSGFCSRGRQAHYWLRLTSRRPSQTRSAVTTTRKWIQPHFHHAPERLGIASGSNRLQPFIIFRPSNSWRAGSSFCDPFLLGAGTPQRATNPFQAGAHSTRNRTPSGRFPLELRNDVTANNRSQRWNALVRVIQSWTHSDILMKTSVPSKQSFWKLEADEVV